MVSPPDGVAASYVRLEDAVPGVEVTSPLGGKVYLISSALDDIDSSLTPLCGMLSTALNNPNAAAFRLLRRAGRSEVPDVQSILFLDLETTGLASVPLFLIGTMLWENGSLVVQQYLARDYSEEKHAIALLAEELENRRLLVSFNGKSFDLPFVENRAVAHRLEIPRPWGHLDLLHEARRVWGRRLPNCKLKTLESHILGRVRWDDIPSSEIPDAYHRFVRTGNAVEMVRIIKHNMRDLVTMAELLLQLPDHD
ncbi:MAG: ribonuclease H-like domain-containing protein [Armatimonadota bacterium]